MDASPPVLPLNAVWFITGCSSGLGRSIASLIAQQSSLRLVATARDVSNLSYLPPGSPNILTLSLDVTSKESISRAVAAALAEFGRIDVVVNNAGYFLFGDTENIPESAARKQMETNFFGSVNVTLEALRVFREANIENGGRRGGLIIQISSSSGFVGLTGSAYYNASKFAIEGFTEGLAKEVHPDWNIGFLIVEPGAVNSQFLANMDEADHHPAYTDPSCPTNQLRAYFSAINSANPDRVANVIIEASSRSDSSLRLPLGADAWEMIKTKVENLRKELDTVKVQSFSV